MEAAPTICIQCERPAAAEVEVAVGLWVGVCAEHLERRAVAIRERLAAN